MPSMWSSLRKNDRARVKFGETGFHPVKETRAFYVCESRCRFARRESKQLRPESERTRTQNLTDRCSFSGWKLQTQNRKRNYSFWLWSHSFWWCNWFPWFVLLENSLEMILKRENCHKKETTAATQTTFWPSGHSNAARDAAWAVSVISLLWLELFHRTIVDMCTCQNSVVGNSPTLPCFGHIWGGWGRCCVVGPPCVFS